MLFYVEGAMIEIMTSKQQFLIDHNKLSPFNLQASLALLTCFKKEKSSLFKDNIWSMDKLRRPFLIWLTSLTTEDKKEFKEKDRL